jgi:hypothetical protein
MSTTQLSKYRKRLRQLIKTIDVLAFRCAHADPLIQGTPGEVFRTCGKKNCPCGSDPAKRHGPYRVIQIYQNKKQRQVALRKDQHAHWQRAKHYQKNMKTLAELKTTSDNLIQLVREILTNRQEPWP